MKNLFLTAALVIALSFNASANTVTESTTTNTTIHQEKEYKRIDGSEVSQEALQNISKKYGGYSMEEAYVAADGEYKLVLSKDGQKVTALFTAAGEFVKEA
ncbi:hypothetical protein [Flavobacterium kingsejongi]|uniref:PepSY domain-containing protein n=1 Tax=Flavobacterium kingsejongi TaxID=1678728 RepID=A0A2S1LNX6_9FLAO|nr:hypothetical protein [Flavobacterium kingsejongi]AWG25419.1 hypothetical protein FK004_09320 [Flavobacterium kingsejongi]